MANSDLLEGKKVLIVDDEPDVLATLEELLSMCSVVKASSFDEAKAFLGGQSFDIAILDIMGVDGFKLLEIARGKNIVSVMLTAHAFSVDTTVKSFKEGAAYYVPKDQMSDIPTFLNDVLIAGQKGKNLWWRWLDRFDSYYSKKFGENWQKKDKAFWEKFKYYI